ncbi:hypothetical protein [Lysinibacillus xylanilyticus]|uniref:Uncharacterized protein n=1 Tax=Lysinibacillus xylanilyticus TaxID=582475 RepID=A0ABT4EXM2_9BACI|nr:hypothetical protein [Lysinibacillus xylanilyticus]MCY9549231.1 hypothetical protein [Lysinibacillus xylanilyticus]MED3803414.1 hypothetical protein [Lysinibacillus xylanilyticus]
MKNKIHNCNDKVERDNIKNLKLSIKYGVISFVIILISWIFINVINSEKVGITTMDIDKLFNVIRNTGISSILSSIFAGLIIGIVFYFYIFPRRTRN